MTTRIFDPFPQFFDSNGNPLSGGKLYFYSAGTSTPKNTYSDAGLTVANPNPVVLDSAGRPAVSGNLVSIFPASGEYKVVLKDSSDVTIWTADSVDGAATTVTAAGSGFRNLLVNGGFAINQRNAGSGIADATYCLDRWYALTQTGTITVAQQTLQENGQPQNIRLTQTQATAQRIGLAQIVEAANSQPLRGAVVAFSARLRCSISQPLRYAILEWTGTGNSVTRDVVNDWTSSSYTAGGFFNSANLVVAGVGTITPAANTWTDTATLTATLSSSTNNLIVMIWSEGTLIQNATLDMGLVQLEATSATAFERRPYGLEFTLCQRFFQVLAAGLRADAYATTGSSISLSTAFAPMRTAPTVSGGAYSSSTNVSTGPFYTSVGTNTLTTGGNVTATGMASFILAAVNLDAEL